MAKNSWEAYKSSYRKANQFFEKLNITPGCFALFDVLHNVIWHEGFDPVRWINENHTLIEKISKYHEITDLPNEINEEIRISLNKLVSL